MNIKEVTPYHTEEDKTTQLYKMFNSISRKYDKFNDIMSMGLAHKWRDKALETLTPYNHNQLLDLACGTADVCIKACRILTPEHVTGVDISEGMMEVGRMRVFKGLGELNASFHTEGVVVSLLVPMDNTVGFI